MLTSKEKYHYDRHLKMEEIGQKGQEKLQSSSVLVIGAGGLGCPALMYLAAAGVGKIGIIDFDSVNETNLHRQILFTSDEIGQNKAEVAKARLLKMNPFIHVETYPYKLTNQNALNLFSNFDVIIDATDNFTTRYMVNDASIITGKPLVYGSVYKFEGQVSVFNYKNGPSYRCLFPDPARNIPSCEEVGVLGVLCGIIGVKQANETLKIILGIGNPLSGRLEIYKALNAESLILKIKRNDEIIKLIQDTKSAFETFDYDLFCGIEKTENGLSSSDFTNLIKEDSIQIIDVRQEWEEPKLVYNDLIAIPLDKIEESIKLLSQKKQIVVICQNGSRSKTAVDFLKSAHGIENIINLEGGTSALENSGFKF